MQGAQVFLRNAVVAEGTETGGHAIDGLLRVLHLLVEIVAAVLDALDGFVAESELIVLGEYFVDLLECKLFGADVMGFHSMLF